VYLVEEEGMCEWAGVPYIRSNVPDREPLVITFKFRFVCLVAFVFLSLYRAFELN
jgi:hypothetical protein